MDAPNTMPTAVRLSHHLLNPQEQLRNAVNVQLVRLLALSGAGGHEAQAEASRWAGASGVPTNPLPPNMDALLTKWVGERSVSGFACAQLSLGPACR